MAKNKGEITMSTEKYQQLAEAILGKVGGQENIVSVTHCMTRLRFNFKDNSVVDTEGLKKTTGVLAVVNTGDLIQVVIGQMVDRVYIALCETAGLEAQAPVAENLDAPKKPLSAKSIGLSILDGLAGSLTPLIPMMMAAAMFKMLVSLLGPSMIGVLQEGSDLYKLFTFVGDAGYYFLPIMVGFTAARKFGVTPVVGMFVGAILLHPTLIEMVNNKTPFTVYGIPVYLQNYANSILPTILSVFVMSFVEKFFKKTLPPMLRTVFAPFLTVLVMLPLMLCLLGPAGAAVGNILCDGLLSFSNYGGIARILAIAVIAALWEYLVMSGMHIIFITTMILVFAQNGSEFIAMPAGAMASIATFGMCLGCVMRIRDKEERSLALGYFVASIIGGVTEPGLYGLGFKYRRPFIGLMAGAFLGGVYIGICNVGVYTMVPSANLLVMLSFAGGSTINLVNGLIAAAIAFIGSAIITYITGFKKDDPLVINRKA
ncbi:MAG: PTS transporter subunit EIIC [Spirochaetaceae bacterium]|jgi:PTS system beta-glucosides-specific IIC component|nr:PTS transporter subunit EIIC [Spirochaetaceae bacterium]